MGFGAAISTCFAKYATFSGRAMRSEFWYIALFLTILSFASQVVDGLLGYEHGPIGIAMSLATIIPSLAAGCRRLHDTDRSGWWQLLWLIPIIGTIVLIFWMARRGTSGANRFGENPLSGMPTLTAAPLHA